MKKLFAVAGVVCLGIASLSPAFSSSLEEGNKEFRTYCAPCHGVSGTGDGPVAMELTNKPIDLTVFAKNSGGVFPEDKVKNLVDGRAMPRAHGTPEMPIWGQWFSYQATAGGLLQVDRKGIEKQVADRLESLVIYLKSIQK